jgi:hypothetical protein
MTTAVIGATGRVGSQIVRGVLARGDAVTALVRDPGKARRAFGEPGGLAGPGHGHFVAPRSVPKCLNDAAAAPLPVLGPQAALRAGSACHRRPGVL